MSLLRRALDFLLHTFGGIDRRLNILHNEEESGVYQHFKFCFAGSCQVCRLRVFLGLPDQYRGNCQILFNDLNPLVVGHNIVVLCAVLNSDCSIENAAELALNLMYSTALTPSMSSALSQITQRLFSIPPSYPVHVPTTGKGNIETMVRPQDLKPTVTFLV